VGLVAAYGEIGCRSDCSSAARNRQENEHRPNRKPGYESQDSEKQLQNSESSAGRKQNRIEWMVRRQPGNFKDVFSERDSDEKNCEDESGAPGRDC
jgi:hypothetical protein